MNLYTDLQARAVISKVAKYMFPNGLWYVDPKTHKVTHDPRLMWDMEWVPTAIEKRDPTKHCGLLKTVLFECLGFHPQYCKNVCHKIVVHPKTFHDLWKLYSIQEKLGYEAKCGTEKRPYIDHLYGGYFYCYSMKEGEEKAREVQGEINKHFREPVGVRLKRGCTEMEDRFGLSSTWKQDSQAIIDAEKHYASYFDFPSELGEYPAWLKPDIMLTWFEWARENNDKTVKEFGVKSILSDIEIEYY